jgi:hypothetical protein
MGRPVLRRWSALLLARSERPRGRRDTFTALWTTLSLFKSLPPSQPSLTLRVSYG